MDDFSKTIYLSQDIYRIDNQNSDKIKPSFSFFSRSSSYSWEPAILKKEDSITKIDNRIILDDVISFENYKGYVTFISDLYFDVVVKSLDKTSEVRKFRIKKSYLKEDSIIQKNQIVLLKIKKCRSFKKMENKIEILLDKPLNRSDAEINSVVAEKMRRYAYMFCEDEKR